MTELNTMNVALVGAGHMGAAIAERVLQAGFPLTVYNRTPGKTEALAALGAEVAEDTAGLLPEGGVCLTVISDDAALEMVTCGPAGVLDGAGAGAVLIDMSTVSPEASSRVAQAAQAADVEYLRAPVSGNPTVVRAGNLTIIVSGPAGALERTSELLTAIGPTIYHVGDGEQARVVKLALQVLIGGTAELLSEALLLGESGGVDRRMLLEVIGSSAAGSPFVKYKTGPLVAGDFSPTFTTRMLAKDVDLVLGFARQRGAAVPLTETLEAVLSETIEAGHGDDDMMALFLELRRRAGLGALSPGGEEAS